MRLRFVILLFALHVVLPVHGADLRLYTVGNSLTDGMGLSFDPMSWDKRNMLQQYVSSSSNSIARLNTCKTAGAPLAWLWNHVPHDNLNTNSPWDVLVLQPFGRAQVDAKYPGLHEYSWGMLSNATLFIHQALNHSPNIQVYLYESWPQIPGYKRHEQYLVEVNPETGTNYTWNEAEMFRQQALTNFEAAGGWEGHWMIPYTDPGQYKIWDSHDYFELAADTLNARRRNPASPIAGLQHDVLLIPVGDVMYELSQRIKADPTLLPRAESAGGGYYTDMTELHADVPHLRAGVGRFICAATWYAVLYKKSPAGLDYTVYNDLDPSSNQYYSYADPYYEEVTPAFAKAVCDAVWDVVSVHPYAGVCSK